MRSRIALLMVLAAVLVMSPANAGAARIKHLGGSYAGLGCATPKVCYTLSQRSVVRLVNGSQTRSQKLPAFAATSAIGCTKGFCAIVGASSVDQRGVVIAISHGKLGRPELLPLTPDAVSCPAAGRCVIAGAALGGRAPLSTIEAVVLAHGKIVSSSKYHFRGRASDPSVLALSCARLSGCELVGDAIYPGGSESYVAGSGTGANIGKLHFIPDGAEDLLSGTGGIACVARARTCYLTGAPRSRAQAQAGKGVLYSLDLRGRALRPVSTVSAGLGVISCASLKYCTVAAIDQHNGTPGIISFTRGKPGTLQLFPSLESVIVNPYAGFSGVVRTSATSFIALGPTAAGGTDVVTGPVS